MFLSALNGGKISLTVVVTSGELIAFACAESLRQGSRGRGYENKDGSAVKERRGFATSAQEQRQPYILGSPVSLLPAFEVIGALPDLLFIITPRFVLHSSFCPVSRPGPNSVTGEILYRPYDGSIICFFVDRLATTVLEHVAITDMLRGDVPWEIKHLRVTNVSLIFEW